MGEYRFSVYFKWQFGLTIGYKYGQILLSVPFLDLHFAIRKEAYGERIFNWQSS